MSETLVVQTNSGPVRGIRREGSAGQQFYTFFAIPYAKAPIGELRFKAPQPAAAWSEVRDATAPGPSAYQNVMPLPDSVETSVDWDKHAMSEDCLYVNVYRPAVEPAKPLPVMVMLHGGGFVMGSSKEDMNNPEFLLENGDIVYVSVNYRLGALGFLSLDDPKYDVPGNAGLKDQSLALRWVRANIAHFGGDATNVTIMGISAGGASVHYHLISPHSEGLFERAICQSGSALNSWANRPQKSDLNERLARALGWKETDGAEAMVQRILSASPTDLGSSAQSCITEADRQNGMMFVFVPTVEPYDNGTVFCGKDLRTMNREAWSHKIPIMVGGTNDEGYMLEQVYRQKKDMFADDGYFANALPRELGLPEGDNTERKRLAEALKRFYYGDAKPSVENFKPYVDLLTEKQFWHGINATVKARAAKKDAAPTYLYNFDYSSEKLLLVQMWMCGRHVEGTVHGEDMLYQFKTPGVNDKLPEDSAERKLRVTYNSLCTSFAATGKPISPATEQLNWQPVRGPAPFLCLNISPEPSIRELPNTKRLQFWDSLCDY